MTRRLHREHDAVRRSARRAYDADITYGTNSEFGFDYLRDNMAVSLDGHRPARPPLRDRGRGRLDPDRRGADAADHLRRARDRGADRTTTSRASSKSSRARRDDARQGRGRARRTGADYAFDEKLKTVSPSRAAIEKVERALRIDNLYDPRNVQLVNHLNQALKAQALYQRDVDYVIQDGEVKIVDEFTGRIMEGRRWSEGLHQAVEAKEGVRDPGGARHARDDHAPELLPPLREARRHDRHGEDRGEGVRRDLRPRTSSRSRRTSPSRATTRTTSSSGRRRRSSTPSSRDIKERHEKGQPVLVGTIAVETSEYLSRAARSARGDPAQRPEREGARARGRDHQGRRPARRGHDRDEHGRPRRRHQARRRRARARRPLRPRHRAPRGAPHRQPAPRPLRPPGRPGRDRASTSPARTSSSACSPATGSRTSWSASSCPDDQPMEAKILSNQIENAQKKVEEQNFVMRKNVLKYDDVMNIAARRSSTSSAASVLEGEDLSEEIAAWIDEVDRAAPSTRYTEAEYARSGTSTALAQAMDDALRLRRSRADELREEVGARPRGARRGVPRGRARGVRGRRSRSSAPS